MASSGRGVRTSEEEAREWADHYVLASSHRAKALHLPSPDSTLEDPHPLCDQVAWSSSNEFRSKPKAVFPPGHRTVCLRCREQLAEASQSA